VENGNCKFKWVCRMKKRELEILAIFTCMISGFLALGWKMLVGFALVGYTTRGGRLSALICLLEGS
jgi:hypothetical protein